MKTRIYLLAALLLGGAFAGLYGWAAAGGSGSKAASGARSPELEYWKAVNSVAPPQDHQALFLLMAEYSNANLQGEGAEFLSARLKEFGPRLTDPQKALYLSAIGLPRATRVFRTVAAPSRVRQGNDLYPGTSQAALRRKDFCCELD